VFIFKAASTLITASASRVALINVSPCNVFWQIGSSATLGTNTAFVGTVMALASVTLNTGATVRGRMMARSGAVTLDDNVITRPVCHAPVLSSSSPSSSAPGGGGSSTPGGGGGSSAPGGGGGGSSTPGGGGPGVPLRSPGTGTATSSPPNVTTTGPSVPGQPPTLARTGSNNGSLALVGVLAIGIGGLLLLIARRRTAGRTASGQHRH
jgi:LPXTG-motif cell wall-anchored protein